MRQEYEFDARDGMRLYGQTWLPEGAVRGRVVLLHGFGDHSARYGHVAEHLNGASFAVHAYDQRGHGRSPGRRAYVARFDDFLDDLDAFLAQAGAAEWREPWFMMGHSMGGMVLTRFLQTRNPACRGAVFSSPFLGFTDDVPPALLKLAGVISSVLPWLPVGKVENAGLSREPAVAAAADKDPLAFHGRVAARTGAEFQRAIAAAEAAYGKITLPALVFHGTADRIVPCRGSRTLFERMGSADKTLKMHEGGFHELWNDTCRGEVLADVTAWLGQRLG